METLTPIQQRIYDGLKNIGEALANFYLDGVRIAAPQCALLSKANMLAHAAREIDGGLRDTFAPKSLAKEKVSEISTKKKQGSEHLASILIAVGKDDPQNELANRWFAIARHFHSFAHRTRIHQGSADPIEITNLWADYENVLDVVIGSFLSITNRLDVLLGFDSPNPKALPIIENILINPRHAHYFFTKLDKSGWLIPLKESGFFEGKFSSHSDETAVVERWWPVRYLLSVSTKVKDEEETALSEIVDDLVDRYTSGEIKLHGFVVSDLLEILVNIKHYSFGSKERSFVEKHQNDDHGWSFVPNLLTERFAAKLVAKRDVDGLSNLLDYFFGFTTEEHPAISFFGEDAKPYYQNRPNVRQHDIKELLHHHGEAIIELLGVDAIKIPVKKIEALIQAGSYNLSHDNPKSIEETSQTVYSHNWEAELVYFIRDNATKLEAQQFSTLTDELLNTKILVLQRLAIHFIRTNYEAFAEKWWRYISSTSAEDDIYIHEPYVLLHEHSGSFNDEQFAKVIAWIERINPPHTDENGSVEKRYAGARIRRWLTALHPKTDRTKRLLTDKEAQYQAWWDGKISEHPEFDSYGESFIGPDYPLEPEAFARLSAAEQITYIQTYQPQHPHDTTEDGLADLLQHNAAGQPDKYVYSLSDFLPLHSLYLSHLIEGLTIALRKERLTEFSLVLDFAETKLSDVHFESEPEKKLYYQRWLTGSIGEFVKIVVFHHQRLGVDGDDLLRMIDLLLLMINNPLFQDDEQNGRNAFANDVYNSTPGRLYLALMDVTKLWADEFTNQGAVAKWPSSVKNHFFERVGSRAARDRYFSIVLGMYMELLLFFDKSWVEENIRAIFDEENLEHFGYRLNAMLYTNRHLSEPFYRFLKEHQLFNKALKHLHEPSTALDTVMDYALLEWKFWEGNPDEGSILADVFAERVPGQIRQLVRTVFERRLLSHDKAIYIWERLLPVFDTTPSLTGLHSILLWLFESITKLDERSFNLATAAIAKSKNGRDIYSFLRHLYQIADDEVEMAGKLVSQVYETKLAAPTYEQELGELVKKLYKLGYNALANDICTQVAEQNSLALKDIYNQYN